MKRTKKERINTDDLLRSVNIVDVVSKYVQLKKDGRTYKGLCPFHNEKSPSFDVDPGKQIYKCFGCGAQGDAIAFLTENPSIRMDFHDACRELGWQEDTTKILKDVVPSSELASIRHFEYGDAVELYPFRRPDGVLLGYTARFLKPDGKKVVLPYTYKFDGSEYGWHWASWDKPRPMYGMERMNGAHTAVLFEGEKSADHAHRLIGGMGYACLSWVGGSSGAKYIDWGYLAQWPVIVCPDNDEAGAKVAAWICENVTAASIRLAEPISGKKGMDIADTDWNADSIIDYLNTAASYQPIPEPDYSQFMEIPERTEFDSSYFKILGFDQQDGQSIFYFFSNRSSSMVILSMSQMTSKQLLQLAPLAYWEQTHPGGKSEFNVNGAVNALMEQAYAAGMFDSSLIRGRGAWIDKKDVVLHSGRYLIVNGEMKQLTEYRSKYVYDRGKDLSFPTCQPLATNEANRFIQFVRKFSWERELDAYLLAGWCVVAPICGALAWRPHIWLTGKKGSGKSWIFSNVVVPMLGESVLNIEGNSSEAGIRQSLRHDAIPVVYDEAEGETKQAQERIQTVLALARSASFENNAELLKGSSGGDAKSYRIRSCFAFASITVQAKQQSDRSRISILSLRGSNPKDDATLRKQQWEALQREYAELITPEYIKALQARTIQQIPTILKNMKAFTAAAAVELGEQRSGDQVGAMLAGVYSLFTADKEITFDEALEWIRKQDWTEEKNNQQSEDERALLTYILEESIMAETAGGGKFTRRIGELVNIAALIDRGDENIGSDTANKNLERYGLKVDRTEQVLYVSNTDKRLVEILSKTAWTPNHHKILLRLPEAFTAEKTVRFAGAVSRAVAVPFACLPSYSGVIHEEPQASDVQAPF